MISEGYKLVQRIGAGTFGEVWRAEAPGGVEVAVKVIFRPITDQEVKRELEALDLIKRLRHPYLLQTQAYWLSDERLHIAMELADCCLRDRFRDCQKSGASSIPVEELLRYFHEAAEALDFLHEERVLHRDVKPENILLMKRHAKVADFGLARLLQQDRQSVSASGAGTPRYMAPEVWHNRVNPASDQYSLALTYLELRLGRHLKEGGNMMDWMFFHLQETPDLSSFGGDEEQVLLRALAKEPSKRFPSCAAFIEELAKAAKLAPVLARPSVASVQQSVAVADEEPRDLFGTIAPAGGTVRDLMPRPRTPPGAMETIPGTPNTPLQTAAQPAIAASRPQAARGVPIWTVGLLGFVVIGSAVGAWMFFRNGATPTSSSKREIEPTRQIPNGKVVVEQFRIERPKPLVLRAGDGKPVTARFTHTPVAAPVKLSFGNAPAGVKLDTEPTTAGGATPISVIASRKAIPGTYPVQVKARVGDVEQQVEWEIRVEPFLPPHAHPAADAILVADMDGEKYYDRIVVTPPAGKPAEFLLVRRTQSTDPATFYIMKNKVSVDQFRDFAATHPQFVTSDSWTKGGRADGKDTGNSDGRHPVLRVTAAQAYQFARWMGGNLPTAQQWDKAAGRFESTKRDGPVQTITDENTNQGVAVNRAKEGPMAVGSAERDVSPLGCVDMGGNGREWTRDVIGPGNRNVPLEKPSLEDRVVLRGRSYAAPTPLSFADLDADLASAQFYNVASPHTGFRVVLDLDES